MKHTFTSNDVRRHYHGKRLPPLKTVTEMAQEFGLTLRQLTGRLGVSEDAPKPIFKHTGSPKNRNTWYNPVEMRAWWNRQSKPTPL